MKKQIGNSHDRRKEAREPFLMTLTSSVGASEHILAALVYLLVGNLIPAIGCPPLLVHLVRLPLKATAAQTFAPPGPLVHAKNSSGRRDILSAHRSSRVGQDSV